MRSVAMLSFQKAPVPTPVGFPVYPAYAGRYKILDLMKLQFSRIAKDARRQFAGLMARPKVEFHVEHRFDTNLTNREFRRRWYRNHRGRFIATEHRRFPVYTARPGPGPLTKSALYLRKEADKDAKRLARSERSKLRANGAEGPPRPARAAGVLRDSVTSTSKTSRGSDSKPRLVPRKGNSLRFAEHAHADPQYGYFYHRLLGGQTHSVRFDFPPSLVDKSWLKYNYFYRVRGYWHTSEHHPYGDEREKLLRFLNENVSSLPAD